MLKPCDAVAAQMLYLVVRMASVEIQCYREVIFWIRFILQALESHHDRSQGLILQNLWIELEVDCTWMLLLHYSLTLYHGVAKIVRSERSVSIDA